MTKKNLMPVIVLTVICVVVAALLGTVNMFTAPMIERKNEAAIKASLEKVMSGGEFDVEPDVLQEGAPETVKKVYTEKNGMGTVVVLLTKKGYTKKSIGITVGVDTEGKITGLVVTQNEESIIPKMLKPGGTYGEAYVGKDKDDIADLETGATVYRTEGAIKSAVRDAFVYLGFEKILPELPRDESEIEALAKEFYGNDSAVLESTTPEGCEYVKRIYREKGSKAYVAYAFVYGSYGPPEFEVLIHVDENGTIKNVQKLSWKVSDPKPEYGYIPPSDERVDEFFDSFVGKNATDILSVDISTGVTNTSGRVRMAFEETLSFADKIKVDNTPRIIGVCVICAAAVAVPVVIVLNKKRRAVK